MSSAPWGSASILPISWIYIAMMGGEGLRKATVMAILNANYIARRSSPHFPIVYSGPGGFVAHECIIDLRWLKERTRHDASRMSRSGSSITASMRRPCRFPVVDTLMIEPTEIESKRELDRFCDAMIEIRREIAEVEAGKVAIATSALRLAPHTTQDIADDNWARPYTRAQGCFPGDMSRSDKYWPPVGRIDHVYGERNLMCSCVPIAELQTT